MKKNGIALAIILIILVMTLVACGENDLDTCEHNVVVDEAVSATCTEMGLTEGAHCSKCGEVLLAQTEVPATGHNHVPAVTEPTCTEKGYTTYTCHCGDEYVADEVVAIGHSPAEAVVENNVAPTCTATGSYDNVVYCSVCDTELSRETKSVDALDHNIVNHNAQAPTCTEVGWEAYETCSRCDYSTYNEIPATGHSPASAVIENNVAPTCTTAGSYDSVVYCSVCDAELSREAKTVTATGHNHVPAVTAPTCTEKGYTTYRCHCGDTYVADEVSATGHNPAEAVVENNVAPTCTAAGSYDNVVYCSVCDTVLSRTTITVDALGHDTIDHEAQAPTCTEVGWEAYETCSRCDHTTYVEIPATGHMEAIDEAVEATLSSPGLTAGSHCSKCNAIIIAQVEISALGSEIESGQNIVANTDYSTREGNITYRIIYSINIANDEMFGLTSLKIGEDETYSINHSYGRVLHIGNGIYELKFEDGQDFQYIKLVGEKFEFCQRDGSECAKDKIEESNIDSTDLVPRQGNSIYGYCDFADSENGESMQELYRRLHYICEAFINSTSNIMNVNGSYILDTIDLNRYAVTADEFVAVWKVFVVENPRYYWLSNSIVLDSDYVNFCIDEAYSKSDYRAQCDASISGMLKDFDGAIRENMSHLEIALNAHNFIINRMNYAYESDGKTPEDAIWAHNIIGCAKYGLGVCESYAETFMFLCKHYGVDVIIVTGDANDEAHAWNIVKIDDYWYGVDVTWDETNVDGEISYDCFGMSKQYCESTHNADSYMNEGVEYLYQLPQMNEKSIELVDLYKNDEFYGTYANIDDAFECMTDQTAEYLVQLYSYGLKGPLLISTSSVVHNINSTATPAVKSITIKGNFIELGGGYATCTSVNIANSITSYAETMTFYDICPNGDFPLYIQDNCLEISGEFSYVHMPIIGNVEEGATSKIVCNAYGNTGTGTEFYSDVQVYEMVVPENVLFRGQSTIVNISAKMIRVLGGSLDVENLYANYEYCNIKLYSNVNLANATIQNAYSDENSINIMLQFGKIEEFPLLTLGNMECNVNIELMGEVHISVTDPSGNEVDHYVEKANPFNVTTPIAHLTRPSDFEKVKINYTNLCEKTSLYKLNEDGDIILKSYSRVNGFVIMEDGAVALYEGTETTLNVPEGVVSIAPYAFYSCSSLVSINFPTTLKSIGERAFRECTSLTSITIPASVTNIGTEAFAYCTSLTSVTFEEGIQLTTIGNSAFYGCTSLTSIVIPNSVTSIGREAFFRCTSLTSITIPASVSSIGLSAFYFCTSMTSVTFEEGSQLASISDAVFVGCDALRSIVIPKSVTSIGPMAFNWCFGLTDVYYEGTEEEWNNIAVGSDNIYLTIATIHYNYVNE